MAKQRPSAARAAPTTCAPQPNRQVKARAMSPRLLRASLLAKRPPRLGANWQAIRRVLFQANSRTKVMLLVQKPAKPPLLEPQD
jgi:hypothetical protein